MWYCPMCGYENDESDEECVNCGALQPVNQGWVGENYGWK